MENRQTPLRKPDLTVQTKLVAPPQAKLDSQFAELQHGNSPVPNAGTVKRFTPSVEDAFRWVDALVFAETNKHLTDVQMFVFWGSWSGQKYDQIAEDYLYSPKYLKQDVAFNLWKILSKALGEKVGKKNFRSVVERQFHLDNVNQANFDGLDELVVSDYVDHNAFPGQEPGREGLKKAYAMFLAAFPDVYFILEDVIAEGDKVTNTMIPSMQVTGIPG